MTVKIELVGPDGGPANELSRRQAAELLQMTPRGIDKLLESGYLPNLGVARILELSRRPFLFAHGDQPVLRQGPVQPDLENERDYFGEGLELTDDQQVEADRMWWRCDPHVVLAAGLLPVTVAGFPTTVLKVHEIERQLRTVIPSRKGGKPSIEVRWSFSATLAARVRVLGDADRDYVAPGLSEEEEATARMFLAGRSAARSGGPIAYLPRVDR